MAREDLTAEQRAKQIVDDWYFGDVNNQAKAASRRDLTTMIERALDNARREALLEAAKLVGDYNCMHDHGKKATKACDDVFDELHRLAQEGAPAASTIDLSPTISDDGGYGEHF